MHNFDQHKQKWRQPSWPQSQVICSQHSRSSGRTTLSHSKLTEWQRVNIWCKMKLSVWPNTCSLGQEWCLATNRHSINICLILVLWISTFSFWEKSIEEEKKTTPQLLSESCLVSTEWGQGVSWTVLVMAMVSDVSISAKGMNCSSDNSLLYWWVRAPHGSALMALACHLFDSLFLCFHCWSPPFFYSLSYYPPKGYRCTWEHFLSFRCG